MSWTIVNFGKYAGKSKTLPQIISFCMEIFIFIVVIFRGILHAIYLMIVFLRK